MHPALRSLEPTLVELLAAQPAAGRPWVSLALPLPQFEWTPALSVDLPHVYWAQPGDSLMRVGLGRIAETRISGYGQLAGLAAARRDLAAGRQEAGPCVGAITDPLFVAFPFNAGSDANRDQARLFLPEVLIEITGNQATLLVSCARSGLLQPARQCVRWLELLDRLIGTETGVAEWAEPAWQPIAGHDDAERWRDRVDNALSAIATGALDKVVVTRSIRMAANGVIDLDGVLARLKRIERNATLFSVSDGETALVGASPEHLGTLRGRTLSVDAMAGTCPVDLASGRDAAPDAIISPKLQLEHRLVVRDIEHALAACCEQIERPEHAQWKVLAHCAHLWTPFRARVRDGVELLDVAAQLHPTAAVAGAPRELAAEWLEAHHQEAARGWYTGGLGWLDAEGGGELIVALRCALLSARDAQLYAGAGIVDGSNPADEFDETEWKLRTMRTALTGREERAGEARH